MSPIHTLFWSILGCAVAAYASSSAELTTGANDDDDNLRSVQQSMDTGGSYEIYDDFQSGFPGSKWFHSSIEGSGWASDDGIATTSKRGLKVVSSGTNPATGQPAFVRTLAQEDENGGLPGGLDHAKWLVFATHTASTGYPGWDAKPGFEVACEARVGGRTFGTEGHPFGANVTNPNNDLRLAAFALSTIDFETYMVYDFFITNRTIYAFYERLPFGRGEVLGNYASFSFAVPVARTSPNERHHLKIGYDKTAGTVRWYVDGKEKFKVNKIGYRIDREYMQLDHGGDEVLLSPNQLLCGMGMFSLLDGHRPSNTGLVRLSSVPDTYYNPQVGYPVPENFVDNESLQSNRLFGQGAQINVKNYAVSYTPSRRD
jgi:hypothetical protein